MISDVLCTARIRRIGARDRTLHDISIMSHPHSWALLSVHSNLESDKTHKVPIVFDVSAHYDNAEDVAAGFVCVCFRSIGT